MSDNYICKECNYTSDASGFCPYCDMPLEPLDPNKVDETTGQAANYQSDELNEDIDDDEVTVANANAKDEPIDEDEYDLEDELIDEEENI